MKIESIALEPFYIDIQEDQYVLIETKTVQDGENKGEKYEMTLGYFKQVDSLVRSIIQRKLARQETIVNLKTFLQKWKELYDEISNDIP